MTMYKGLIITLTAGVSIMLLAGCNKRDGQANNNEYGQLQEPLEPVAATEAIDPSTPVVTVEGEPLNRGELERRKRMVAMRQGIPPQAIEQALELMGAQIEQQVIEQFIDVTLLLKEAEKRGLTVTAEKIDEVLGELLADLPPEVDLEDLLRAQGVTRKEIRDDIEKSERIRALVDDETADMDAVSDEDVKAFYDAHPEHFTTPEEVTASHILITVDKEASDEEKAAAKEKIENLRNQIIAGEISFEDAAAEHSACPSGQQGGSLGAFGRGQMVTPFEDAAFAQTIGELGPVVETSFGYHIIKVSERTASEVTAFDDVRADIASYLDDDKKGDVIQALLLALREKATIEHH